MGSQRVGHDWASNFTFSHQYKIKIKKCLIHTHRSLMDCLCLLTVCRESCHLMIETQERIIFSILDIVKDRHSSNAFTVRDGQNLSVLFVTTCWSWYSPLPEGIGFSSFPQDPSCVSFPTWAISLDDSRKPRGYSCIPGLSFINFSRHRAFLQKMKET